MKELAGRLEPRLSGVAEGGIDQGSGLRPSETLYLIHQCFHSNSKIPLFLDFPGEPWSEILGDASGSRNWGF